MTTPLDGIRVVDLTRVLSGPFCTMLLGDMGAEVVAVDNGLAALEAAKQHTFDLVLMDIRLAEGNGMEAAEAIHTRWAIPSLFATSYAEHSAGACPAALGCLRKPTTAGALYAAPRSSSR